MTTLENRPNAALLVIDVQNGVVDGAHRRDEVVANRHARRQGPGRRTFPSIWVQHSSDELPPAASSGSRPGASPTRPSQSSRSAIGLVRGDDLESVLAPRGVGRLVVAGAQTDACVRSTLHGASIAATTRSSSATRTRPRIFRGRAHPHPTVIAHTNLYWKSHAPRLENQPVVLNA